MALANAVAAFGEWCKKNKLFFSVPHVCSRIYIGMDHIEFMETLYSESERKTRIVSEKGIMSLQDSYGEYLRCDQLARYVTSFYFDGLASQIPEEMKYVYKKNTYVTDTIIDGCMLWLKSAKEIKVKQVKDVPGNNISSGSLGITTVRGLTRDYAERSSAVWAKLQQNEGKGYNPEYFKSDEKLISAVSKEKELNQERIHLEYTIKQLDKKLSVHEDMVSSLNSNLESVRQEYIKCKEDLEKSVTRYGEHSLEYLIRNGYLRREKDGSISFIPSSRRPDTIKKIPKSKIVKRNGEDPKTGKWYTDDGLFKYHNVLIEWDEEETVADPDWVQARNWNYYNEDLSRDVSRLYDRYQSLKFQRDVAVNNKTVFDSGDSIALIREKREAESRLKVVIKELEELRSELYIVKKNK